MYICQKIIKMKKSIMFLFLSLCLVWQAIGQENEQQVRKNYFYMSPFSLFTSHFKIAYERDIGNNSIVLMGGIILRESFNELRKGGTAELHYRINLYDTEQGKTRHRVYWGPFAKYRYMEVDYTETESICVKWDTSLNGGTFCTQYDYPEIEKTDILRSGSGGMVMGWRITHAEKINFDIYLGGEAKISKISGRKNNYGNIFQSGYTGVLPVAGFQFGVSF